MKLKQNSRLQKLPTICHSQEKREERKQRCWASRMIKSYVENLQRKRHSGRSPPAQSGNDLSCQQPNQETWTCAIRYWPPPMVPLISFEKPSDKTTKSLMTFVMVVAAAITQNNPENLPTKIEDRSYSCL